MQIFYSEAETGGYPFSQKNSQICPVRAGINDHYIQLDSPDWASILG